MLRRLVVLTLVFGSVIGLSNVAFAQKKPTGPQGTPIKIDGTVKEIVAQGIVVSGKDGKTYGVGFTPTSKVGLVGTAGVEFIKPNTFVQFDVELDDKGQPVGEVKKIQITSQSAINEPGIFSAKGPDGKPGEPGPYFVRGTVNTNKDGTLTVTAGGKRMTVKAAVGISVPVTISDWRLAKPNDTITGDGNSFGPQPGLAFIPVQGTLVEIKAVGPIEMGKKR